MAIAFKRVKFEVDRAPMAAPYSQKQGFTIPGKIRNDEKGRPVINVMLQSYSLEVLENGNPSHCSMSLDQVGLEIVSSEDTDEDGQVKLTLWRRNHPNHATNPGWGFKGTVTALVIADLMSS
ncbi:hypothetical protein [Streptomyces sp. NPDC053048]|uniref:hypothetical protein n=1 Tax=Streptomyces sp. NPDC053048 TaxID=3365694 RepID=UPI0037D969A1